MDRATIVVPCFEEAKRLDTDRFVQLAREPEVQLLFVDDGSKDDTLGVLRALQEQSPESVRVKHLPVNRGKAEAVRQGMLEAIERGARLVGFADADLATPPRELVRLVRELDHRAVQVVLGSRVLLVGHHIDRKVSRHLLGRVFATVASLMLHVPFYDTQCGAKFFRVSTSLRAALSQPFHSRWAFDVELLGRLLVGFEGAPPLPLEGFREVPLEEWIEVGDSKLRFGGMAKSVVDLGRIQLELRRLRKSRS
jgi:glycosyltransferase involved in cell wall biosynthesis